jgi:predicted flap endonuclease-1-like 5' DNA nuclease
MISLFDFCSVHPLLPWLLPFLLGLGIGWLLWARFKNEVDHLQKNLLDVNQNRDQLVKENDALKKNRESIESQLQEVKQKMRDVESTSARAVRGSSEENIVSFNKSSSQTITQASDLGSTSQNKSESTGIASSIVAEGIDNTEKNNSTSVVSISDVSSSVPTISEEALDSKLSNEKTENTQQGGDGLISNDNLQVLEGVGPKVQSILLDHGIKTFEDLSYRSPDQLRAILDTYGTRYRMIDPEPWIGQARLAVNQDWDGVVEAQKYIYSRKNPESNQMPDTKLEKYLIKIGYLRKYNQDDLKAVEGVGPKIEELLHDANIITWANLADTTVSRLKVILEQAGPKYMLADPTTWPDQALLAHKGDWAALFDLQEKLKGGRQKG